MVLSSSSSSSSEEECDDDYDHDHEEDESSDVDGTSDSDHSDLDDSSLSDKVVALLREGNDIESLKLNECKAYLRKHGLRITGNREVCVARIREHWRLKHASGYTLYPRSSFTINCTGDVCMGDVVLFKQKVYEKFDKVTRHGKVLGTRTITGRVVKESYGVAKQQHTFTVEVLWSIGVRKLPPLFPLLVKGRNLYKQKTYRQIWKNEADRVEVLREKHKRGAAARYVRALKQKKKSRHATESKVSLVTMTKRPDVFATEAECQARTKVLKTAHAATGGFVGASNSLSIVGSPNPGQEPPPNRQEVDSELYLTQAKRYVLDGNSTYLHKLKDRKEIGYRKSHAAKALNYRSFEIDIDVFRAAITDLMNRVLLIRYHSQGSMRPSEITAEITYLVPKVVDMCMAALYAKLRYVNNSYGRPGSRYSITPTYNKDFELPLPLTLAIEEFGAFQTHSLQRNEVHIPTFPEGVQNEGRSTATLPSAEYLSFVQLFSILEFH